MQHFEYHFLSFLSLRCSLSSSRFESKHMMGLQGTGILLSSWVASSLFLLHSNYENTQPLFGPLEEHKNIWRVSEIRLYLILEFYFYKSTLPKFILLQEAYLPQHHCRGIEQMKPGRHGAWEEPPKGGGPLEGTGSRTAQFSVPNSLASWFLGKIPNRWYDSTSRGKQQFVVERTQGNLGLVECWLPTITPDYLQLRQSWAHC